MKFYGLFDKKGKLVINKSGSVCFPEVYTKRTWAKELVCEDGQYVKEVEILEVAK
jgi:hypothetical protein